MKNNLYTPERYPIKTFYEKRILRGPLKGSHILDNIHHISVEAAERWVEGCRKNCKQWEFVGDPEHNQNK